MHIFNSQKGQLYIHLPYGLFVDVFAGGGGASIGVEMGTGRPVDIAINHSHPAITMHKANHPYTQHYKECVWDVDPLKESNNLPIMLAWFSPDCTHHSKARGRRPREKHIRALAWVKIKWALLKRPLVMMLENVEEFKSWGPLDENGSPIESMNGHHFDAFIAMLTSGVSPDNPCVQELLEYLPAGTDISPIFKGLGYQVDWRELKACDYGAPTRRNRLFMIARCDGSPIVWPEPTHSSPDDINVQAGNLLPYRTASEIIDWSIPINSIFNRTRPLVENTLKKIYNGIRKFVFNDPNPFIFQIDEAGLDECTSPPLLDNQLEVNTFLSKFSNHNSCDNDPMYGNYFSGTMAFILKYYGNNDAHSLNEPLHTITTKERFALVTVHFKNGVIVDICMRMLQPHELFAAQGFPEGYIHEVIDQDTGRRLSKASQVRMCGNSVSPLVVKALVEANNPIPSHKFIAA